MHIDTVFASCYISPLKHFRHWNENLRVILAALLIFRKHSHKATKRKWVKWKHSPKQTSYWYYFFNFHNFLVQENEKKNHKKYLCYKSDTSGLYTHYVGIVFFLGTENTGILTASFHTWRISWHRMGDFTSSCLLWCNTTTFVIP